MDGQPPNLALSRPTWVRYQVLAAACLLAVLIYIPRVGFASVLPNIKTDLGLDDRHAAWLIGAFLLAYGGFEMPWGIAGDHLGVRQLLPILVLGWSLVTGCVALAVLLPQSGMLPFAFLMALRFLFGTFQAGAFPLLSRMLTDWMPMKERASAQGAIWMCTRLGGMIIPLLLGWLISVFGNWQTPLWLVAFLGVFWCAGFYPWFRNRPEEMPRVNAAERQLIALDRRPAAGHSSIPWKKMLRSRSVWALCCMYGCGAFAANFYVTLLPTYLANRGLPAQQRDLLTSLPFACGAVSCILGGIVSDWIIRRTGNRKWGRRLTGTFGTLVGGLGWLHISWAPDTASLALVLCVIFFCNDLAMGPAWAACSDIGERYAGTLGGAMNMVGNLAGFFGGLLTGYLFKNNLSEWVFIIFACSFWLGTLCWQGVDVTRPLTAERPAGH